MIDRSTTQDSPLKPMAKKVAGLLGAGVAETILASVHARAHSKVGHMDASDLIKTGCMILRGGCRPHMVSGPGPAAFKPEIFRGPANPEPICQPSPPAGDQGAFSLPRLDCLYLCHASAMSLPSAPPAPTSKWLPPLRRPGHPMINEDIQLGVPDHNDCLSGVGPKSIEKSASERLTMR